MLAFALPLAAVDLITKALLPTEDWAYHQRSPAWGLLCCIVLVGLLVVCRVPTLLVPPATGFLMAGVVGNGLSAVLNGFVVPNPLVIEGNQSVVAFNLADVWAVVGILSLMVVIAVWLIRNRHLLPSRRRAAAEKADAMTEEGQTVY
jgi:hypothetical protein